MDDTALRHDYSIDEIRQLHDLPLFELMDRARDIHRISHQPNAIQLCSLLSVKTGGCSEDCGYCPQSSRHATGVQPGRLLGVEAVVQAARRAKEQGASRFCMGAAWRDPRDGAAFERVLEMVRGVKSVGIEACASLGMLTEEQAQKLKQAGLDAYNHNLDTSRAFYASIISTRTFDERMTTLRLVQRAGIRVCTGGIIGMGETIDDRCGMLQELVRLDPHPDSVPINALVRVAGTPLEQLPPIDPLEMVRMVAVARILMPKAMVRLSAGRSPLGRDAQLLCMYAGANSIFIGDRLLTTDNVEPDDDHALLRATGLVPLSASL